MLENNISIDSQNTFNISLADLRDVEQNILNYMLLSETNFLEIVKKLTEDDFTFNVHKIIFSSFCIHQSLILDGDSYGIHDLDNFLKVFSIVLYDEHKLKKATTVDILSQPPSSNIEKDIEVLNANSMEKEIVMHNFENEKSVTIETKNSGIHLVYINDKLISANTRNVKFIPPEAHDNFNDSFNSLTKLDLENGDNIAKMSFYGDPENPDGIKSFFLTKDVQELKWFDDICEWADRYNLSDAIFPRNKYDLLDLEKLNISNMGIKELPKEIGKLSSLEELFMNENSIKEFPKELYQLKNLTILSFVKNEISFISQEISNIKGLLAFAACNNNITELPMSFYKLNKLKILCLHGTRITMVPDEIGNLSSLKSLTLSNNDIKVLPQSISKLDKLDSLEIENTKITNIPIDLLQHKNLSKLSINDDLLEFFIKNMKYLNVDTINLTASDFQESSEIVKKLDFKIDRESWIEDRDKLDNGCVVLSKYKDEEDEK